jgi:hypothetical protein
MELHEPFIIGPRLLPALRIGDAFLSLDSVTRARTGRRLAPVFILDIGSDSYRIDDMSSGAGGFRSAVEPFNSLLSLMAACAEALHYRERTGHCSDNADLFEPTVAQWCADHSSDIEAAQCDLQDENGNVRHSLIVG